MKTSREFFSKVTKGQYHIKVISFWTNRLSPKGHQQTQTNPSPSSFSTIDQQGWTKHHSLFYVQSWPLISKMFAPGVETVWHDAIQSEVNGRREEGGRRFALMFWKPMWNFNHRVKYVGETSEAFLTAWTPSSSNRMCRRTNKYCLSDCCTAVGGGYPLLELCHDIFWFWNVILSCHPGWHIP